MEEERERMAKPNSAFSLFKNKQFNLVRERLSHLSHKEINQHIHEMWKTGTSKDDRAKYETLGLESESEYFKLIDEANTRVNDLKKKIFELKFGGNDNKAVKPSGKLRFMSAFRFYRREAVPEVKVEQPELDGKARHKVVRERWRQLGIVSPSASAAVLSCHDFRAEATRHEHRGSRRRM